MRKDTERVKEMTARTMDRLYATRESEMGGIAFEFRLEDIEAVIGEMADKKPCGVCGQDRCVQRGDS